MILLNEFASGPILTAETYCPRVIATTLHTPFDTIDIIPKVLYAMHRF